MFFCKRNEKKNILKKKKKIGEQKRNMEKEQGAFSKSKKDKMHRHIKQKRECTTPFEK